MQARGCWQTGSKTRCPKWRERWLLLRFHESQTRGTKKLLCRCFDQHHQIKKVANQTLKIIHHPWNLSNQFLLTREDHGVHSLLTRCLGSMVDAAYCRTPRLFCVPAISSGVRLEKSNLWEQEVFCYQISENKWKKKLKCTAVIKRSTSQQQKSEYWRNIIRGQNIRNL